MFGLIFGAKTGGLEKQKQAFRIVHVAKYEVSLFREKASKMRCKRGSQMIPKSRLGRPGVRFLSLWEVVAEVRFLTNS